MKHFLTFTAVILLAFVFFMAYHIDQWLGVVAYTYRYLLFSMIGGTLFGLFWLANCRKHAVLAGVIAFSLLASLFLFPPPSERLLRSVMLRVPEGADANSIESIVKEQYAGSEYVLPQITEGNASGLKRVHVSLLSQKDGNCSAVIFMLNDNVVVDRRFSAD